jgi:hypothetical protein
MFERERCNACGKLCFPTKAEARASLSDLARESGTWKAYPCIFGDHWHITKGSRNGGKKKGLRRH